MTLRYRNTLCLCLILVAGLLVSGCAPNFYLSESEVAAYEANLKTQQRANDLLDNLQMQLIEFDFDASSGRLRVQNSNLATVLRNTELSVLEQFFDQIRLDRLSSQIEEQVATWLNSRFQILGPQGRSRSGLKGFERMTVRILSAPVLTYLPDQQAISFDLRIRVAISGTLDVRDPEGFWGFFVAPFVPDGRYPLQAIIDNFQIQGQAQLLSPLGGTSVVRLKVTPNPSDIRVVGQAPESVKKPVRQLLGQLLTVPVDEQRQLIYDDFALADMYVTRKGELELTYRSQPESAPPVLDMAVRGEDGNIYHSRRRADAWGPFTPVPLPEAMAADPALVASGPDQLEMVAVGASGQLYYTSWRNGEWGNVFGSFSAHGWVLAAQKPALVATAPGQLEVISVASGSGLRHLRRLNGVWHDEQFIDYSPAVPPFRDPVAVQTGNQILLLYVDTHGHLFGKIFDLEKGVWGMTLTFGNQAVRYAPAAAATGDGRIDIAYVGSDNRVYQKVLTLRPDVPGGLATESPAIPLEGAQLSGSPGLVCSGYRRLELVGRGTNGRLWHNHFVDSIGDIGITTFTEPRWADNWALWEVNPEVKILTGDFNGDGKTDVLKLDVPGSGSTTSDLMVGLSDGATFNVATWAQTETDPGTRALSGDFNGDGKTDVLTFTTPFSTNPLLPFSGPVSVTVGLSDGIRFNPAEWDIWEAGKRTKTLAGDFNGDGKTDVLKFDVPLSGSAPTNVYVSISTGTGFTTSLWDQWEIGPDTKILAGYFNSDSKTDVLRLDLPTSGNTVSPVLVGLSDGQHFSTQTWDQWDAGPGTEILAGDFNNDGWTDVLKYDSPTEGSVAPGLFVGLSDGTRFNTTRWANWDTTKKMKVLTGDFNGDGNTDVWGVYVSFWGWQRTIFSYVYLGLSDGIKFNTQRRGIWEISKQFQALDGDFNGDGKTDVMKFDIPSSGTAFSRFYVALALRLFDGRDIHPGWQGWQEESNYFFGTPSLSRQIKGTIALAATRSGQVHLAAMGDGSGPREVYHNSYDADRYLRSPWTAVHWRGFQDTAEDKFVGSPALTATDRQLNVTLVGSGNSLWHADLDAKNQARFKIISDSAVQSPSSVDPVVVSSGPGLVDVFAMSPYGSLEHMRRRNGTWTKKTALAVPATHDISSIPAVVAYGSGQIDLVALTQRGALYHWRYGNGQWHPPGRIGSDVSIISVPVLVHTGAGQLSLFAVGSDQRIYNWRFLNGQWQSPKQLSSDFAVSAMTFGANAVSSWGDGTVDLIAAEPYTGKMFHTRILPAVSLTQRLDTLMPGTAPSGFREIIGGNTTDIPALTALGPGRLNLMIRAQDGLIYSNSTEPDKGPWFTSAQSVPLPAPGSQLRWQGFGLIGSSRFAMIGSVVHMEDGELVAVAVDNHARVHLNRMIGWRWTGFVPLAGQPSELKHIPIFRPAMVKH